MTPVKGWRVVFGNRVLVRNERTRTDAVACAFDPRFGMKVTVFQKLQKLDRSTAGWTAIEHSGWKIEPLSRSSKAHPLLSDD